MLKTIKGAAVGCFIGVAIGVLLALVIDRYRTPPPSGWTSYPTINHVVQGVQRLTPDLMDLNTLIFFGVLFGGGFGAVAGSTAGAAAAIVAAIKDPRPSGSSH